MCAFPVVMHVHRAFFAQALLQSPSDPLGTVYAPSFLGAYQIASTMVHLNVKNYYKYPNVLSRYWEIWTGRKYCQCTFNITSHINALYSPQCWCQFSYVHTKFHILIE